MKSMFLILASALFLTWNCNADEAQNANDTILFSGPFNNVTMKAWQWTRHAYADKNPPNLAEILKTVKGTATAKEVFLSVGKEALQFTNPATGEKYMVESGITRIFDLSPASAGKTVSFQADFTGQGKTQALILFPGNSHYKVSTSQAPTNKVSTKIPAGVKKMQINFLLYGAGEIHLQSGLLKIQK